ncbi:MAG: hypothetical protein VZR06_15075 [Butyrivibrio sp.]|nr:hypothetical protein [Butyrivibrio sp.]
MRFRKMTAVMFSMVMLLNIGVIARDEKANAAEIPVVGELRFAADFSDYNELVHEGRGPEVQDFRPYEWGESVSGSIELYSFKTAPGKAYYRIENSDRTGLSILLCRSNDYDEILKGYDGGAIIINSDHQTEDDEFYCTGDGVSFQPDTTYYIAFIGNAGDKARVKIRETILPDEPMNQKIRTAFTTKKIKRSSLKKKAKTFWLQEECQTFELPTFTFVSAPKKGKKYVSIVTHKFCYHGIKIKKNAPKGTYKFKVIAPEGYGRVMDEDGEYSMVGYKKKKTKTIKIKVV